MKDIRQTPKYARFIEQIGWKFEYVEGTFVYIKKIPLVGTLIKIQRPPKLPDVSLIENLLKKYRSKSFLMEPDYNSDTTRYPFTKTTEPNIATKTIHIDLRQTETEIFKKFSEAKRRAVRRAEKYGVRVTVSQDINQLIRVKNRSGGIFGFMSTSFLKPLWQTFAPDQSVCLLAYPKDSRQSFACIFLIWAEGIAYYWIAGASKEGKKQFAPTLLVWEALKLAKQKGNAIFDFEGIYDERFPTHKNWLGFTKFKEGFGGNVVYFPKPIKIK